MGVNCSAPVTGTLPGGQAEMKKNFTAVVWQEDDGFVAQCLEVDVASQGESEGEALTNLQEALELYFEPPLPTVMPGIRQLRVDLHAA